MIFFKKRKNPRTSVPNQRRHQKKKRKGTKELGFNGARPLTAGNVMQKRRLHSQKNLVFLRS
jgi:hypothetical protein